METLLKADETIAENIARLRNEKKLSQYTVAAQLQAMGLNYSRSRLSMIERKQRAIPASLIVGLSIVFGCAYEDFFEELDAALLHNMAKQ